MYLHIYKKIYSFLKKYIKNNDSMLEKTLHLILGKLLIVGGLKEPYSAIVGC
jgi:hypothetical protein